MRACQQTQSRPSLSGVALRALSLRSHFSLYPRRRKFLVMSKICHGLKTARTAFSVRCVFPPAGQHAGATRSVTLGSVTLWIGDAIASLPTEYLTMAGYTGGHSQSASSWRQQQLHSGRRAEADVSVDVKAWVYGHISKGRLCRRCPLRQRCPPARKLREQFR